MNMLIIGNGFDLAHKRPTSYADFLQFLELILNIRNYKRNRTDTEKFLAEKYNHLCLTVKNYLLDSSDTRRVIAGGYDRNTNNRVQELYDCLDANIWYEYFKRIRQENLINGKNWIDFEKEILEVIAFFDCNIANIYNPVSEPSSGSVNEKVLFFWKLFSQKIRQEKVQNCTWSDFIDKTYQDLQDLVRCLEIYLDDCLSEMRITYCSPDIKELKIDFILSFNYTEIPTDIYPSLSREPHYIHGCANAKQLAVENNMVLGVNEYWHGEEADTHTNFNLYKKFVQRIIKETGTDYKKALKYMKSVKNKQKTVQEGRNSGSLYTNHIYIFGHSLDITDKEILKEIIETDDTDTTIFYKDKQQQANQIANLSRVLGQKKLLDSVFSISPTIIFKQQAKMIELPAILTDV